VALVRSMAVFGTSDFFRLRRYPGERGGGSERARGVTFIQRVEAVATLRQRWLLLQLPQGGREDAGERILARAGE
jgi:hypothetical protein